MSIQCASVVVMIRPAAFGYNEQTAGSNFFQQPVTGDLTQEKALAEFDCVVATLTQKGVNVIVYDDLPFPHKPDAIFPNNWFCTLPDGTVAIFPLATPNRIDEKRNDIAEDLSLKFDVGDVEDWSEYEAEGFFLEGTGSMVFDFANKLIYACLSSRTHKAVLEKFAASHQYKAIVFSAQLNGQPVYHTNVLMSIGEGYAVLCSDCFTDEDELIAIKQLLLSTNHEIINITNEQMLAFAGNQIQLQTSSDNRIIVMSQSAIDSLAEEQKTALSKYGELVAVSIPTIESAGGGSLRCMLADIHLKEKQP
ncbi:MAG: amidinotransferase [Chitinophagaceae bacterium]|nr:amidinotransferase [Chitinophagaceae bacterium]